MDAASFPGAGDGEVERLQDAYVFQASFAQERMWFFDQFEPGSPLYNVSVNTWLRGDLDAAALERAFTDVVRRHETLRTRFSISGGRLVQVVSPEGKVLLDHRDVSILPEADRRAEVERLADEQARGGFDLRQGPLIRAMLLRVGPGEHVLLLTVHHIVFDGWSIGILMGELSALYGVFSSGAESPLGELPIQYGDYAEWQREALSGPVLEERLSYWKERLAGAPALLDLPTDHPRPAVASLRAGRVTRRLPPQLFSRLREIARTAGATNFMVMLAAFDVLLSRYAGQEDVIVGSPVAGRDREETEGVIGLFVNTIVLRTDCSGGPTFRELLGRVKETALGAYAHQDLPFEKLVAELKQSRTLSHSAVVQVLFSYRGAPRDIPPFAGLSTSRWWVPRGASAFDLELDVLESPDGLHCAFDYSADLFESDTIARMAGHFENLLEAVAANPDRRIGELPLLGEAERNQLLFAWNQTRAPFPEQARLEQLFEDRVAIAPDSLAAVCGTESLTYRELNARANQLAHHLRGLGVGPDALVGICMRRSLEMLVAFLGVLKSGGAYVPLDPTYPRDRLAFMLDDCGASVVLTQAEVAQTLPADGRKVVRLDQDWKNIARESDRNPSPRAGAEGLAYVIYTSGSTGAPKGVEICHRSVVNYTTYCRKLFELSPGDRILQFHSISFDTAAEEIFPCLSTGATLLLRDEEMLESASAFLKTCSAWRLTILDLPTAYWHELAAGASRESLRLPESLRLVIIGGERALRERLAQWLTVAGPGVGLLNGYGPTETTIATTFCELGPSDLSEKRELPIGRPIDNARAYILDSVLQPVPIGVPGELHIGGEGLARGYLGRPELTAERFVRDPFSGEGGRLYKTGDLARYRPDGSIEFLGRRDRQVKIRGFRVEPAEVEKALRAVAGVREAAVLARNDVPGETRLVGYAVPDPSCPPTPSDLRRALQEIVPAHMVPSAFVVLDSLPKTPSGKLDLSALPPPESTRPAADDASRGPRTPVEETLTAIWANVLGLDRVDLEDNFFEIGGHSLIAIRLMSRIRDEFGVELPLRSLFQAPTVSGLALLITQRQADSGDRGEILQMLDELESLGQETSPKPSEAEER